MTTTRATSPLFISQLHPIGTNKHDKTHILLTCYVLYVKLHIWQRRPEGVKNDGNYDGRISYRRRSRQQAQNVRRNSQATLTNEEDGRIQDQWCVAHHFARLNGICRQAEEYSRRQIIKAGRIRLSKKFVAQSSLTVFQDLRDDLSSRYLVSIIGYGRMPSQVLLCFSTRDSNRYGGSREDTMFTTIGNPLSQVYPYDLTNSPSAIFGVRGSEVAG